MAVSQSLTVTEVVDSTDVANNTSKVKIVWKSTQTNQSRNDNNLTGYYWVSINGGAETKYTVTTKLPYQSTKTILDTTITVAHKNDGSGSVSVRSSIDTRISAGTITKSASCSLTTIPRASQPTMSTTFNIGDTINIKMNRKSTAFKHKVFYKISGGDWVLIQADVADNCSWNTTGLFALCPNSKSISGVVGVDTYNGNTWIGVKEVAFTGSITNSNPTLSPTIKDVNAVSKALTGNENKLIRYVSNAQYSINGSPKNSATLKSYTAVNGSSKLTTATGTFNSVQNNKFDFTVTDSRGFSTAKTLNPQMVEYIKLTNNTEIPNPTTSGNTTVTISGIYFNGSFGATNNTLLVKYRFKEDGGEWCNYVNLTPTALEGTYTADIQVTGLDYTKTYIFQTIVQDKIYSIDSGEIKVKSIPIFDWSNMDFNFNVPVNFSAGINGLSEMIKIQMFESDKSGITLQPFAAVKANPSPPNIDGYKYIATLGGWANGNVIYCAPNGWVRNIGNNITTVNSISWLGLYVKN